MPVNSFEYFFEESFSDGRIKLGSRTPPDFVHSLFAGQGFAIGPFFGHGVIGINDSQNT